MSASAPKIPACCMLCLNFNKEESLCSIYDYLPGEYSRENIEECPSFLEQSKEKEDSLKLLAKYIEEDPDSLVEEQLNKIVNNIVNGYQEKYKIMVLGIARRKIKAMVKMVDIIDVILNRISESTTIEDMSTNQTIRLLSELNSSINTDLTFIMKLVNPDTKLKDLQAWVDARSIININGASATTEMKTEEILNMTNVSREKIRDAFDVLLNNLVVEDVEEEYELSKKEEEELNLDEDI